MKYKKSPGEIRGFLILMKSTDKKKASVKQMPNEDTSKYIDYSQPLNLKQLVKNSNASFKKKPGKKAA